jgi:hypothetical protein
MSPTPTIPTRPGHYRVDVRRVDNHELETRIIALIPGLTGELCWYDGVLSQPLSRVERWGPNLDDLEKQFASVRDELSELRDDVLSAARNLLPFLAGHEHDFRIDKIGPYESLMFTDGNRRERRDCSLATFTEILAAELQKERTLR